MEITRDYLEKQFEYSFEGIGFANFYTEIDGVEVSVEMKDGEDEKTYIFSKGKREIVFKEKRFTEQCVRAIVSLMNL